MSNKNALQKGVQSVEIAAQVLSALAKFGGEGTLKWISAETDLSPSRLHSYLVSLRRSGLVEQNGDTGLYRLGPLTRQIGLAAIDQLDQYDILISAAKTMRDQSGKTVCVSVWTDRGPMVAHWARGVEPLTLLIMNSGLTPPLLTTALGRVFLSFLPASETEQLAKEELTALVGGEVFTRLQEPGAIDRLKSTIRAQGYAVTQSILSPYSSAIAAPIIDNDGELVAVLEILGRGLDPKNLRTEKLVSELTNFCRDVGSRIHF